MVNRKRKPKRVTILFALLITVFVCAVFALVATYAGGEKYETAYLPDAEKVSVYLPALTAENETPTGWTLNTPTYYESSQIDEVEDLGGYENALHYWYTDDEIDALARMVWGEARDCAPEEQALTVWTVLNRVDDGYWGDTIMDVLKYPGAFAGYKATHPIDKDMRDVCQNAVVAWAHFAEPPTLAPYATTMRYLYFDGDGEHNWFREEWK